MNILPSVSRRDEPTTLPTNPALALKSHEAAKQRKLGVDGYVLVLAVQAFRYDPTSNVYLQSIFDRILEYSRSFPGTKLPKLVSDEVQTSGPQKDLVVAIVRAASNSGDPTKMNDALNLALKFENTSSIAETLAIKTFGVYQKKNAEISAAKWIELGDVLLNFNKVSEAEKAATFAQSKPDLDRASLNRLIGSIHIAKTTSSSGGLEKLVAPKEPAPNAPDLKELAKTYEDSPDSSDALIQLTSLLLRDGGQEGRTRSIGLLKDFLSREFCRDLFNRLRELTVEDIAAQEKRINLDAKAGEGDPMLEALLKERRNSLEELHHLDPKDHQVLGLLGTTLSRLKLHEEAIVMFQKVLAGGDSSAEIYIQLGESFAALGLSSAAILTFERGLEKHPRANDNGNIQLRYACATLYAQLAEGVEESRSENSNKALKLVTELMVDNFEFPGLRELYNRLSKKS